MKKLTLKNKANLKAYYFKKFEMENMITKIARKVENEITTNF